MGDTFFKTFFISCFVILGLAGLVMFLQMEADSSNRREVQEYMDTRGKAGFPASWSGQVGRGI